MVAAIDIQVINDDCIKALRTLLDQSVNCCVTSPPYWGLRDYGVDGQIGLEQTPDDYVSKMVEVLREVKRVLRDDGTLWLNLGDSYAAGSRGYNSFRRDRAHVCVPRMTIPQGLKPKDLVGIPWRVAFALQADGWYLRSDIIWAKPNPMPESVIDRPTKAHEYLFLLSKSGKYYYDAETIKEPAAYGHTPTGVGFGHGTDSDSRSRGRIRTSVQRGEFNGKTNDLQGREAFRSIKDYRNKRTVWTVATKPYPEAHFATYPPELIEPCILAGCPVDGTVIDPFAGSGTTLEVAARLGRNSIGIELNPEYIKLIEKRVRQYREQNILFA